MIAWNRSLIVQCNTNPEVIGCATSAWILTILAKLTMHT